MVPFATVPMPFLSHYHVHENPIYLKPKILCLFLIPFVVCLGIWIKDDVRLGFWLTSVEEKKEIPIIDGMPELGTQTQIVWQDKFVSGVETPLIGLLLSISLVVFFYIRKQRMLG